MCVLLQYPGHTAWHCLGWGRQSRDVLADIEGKDGSATLQTTGEGQGEARWDDAVCGGAIHSWMAGRTTWPP
jgi:hypothetical protein